jgi:hypothetical protein
MRASSRFTAAIISRCMNRKSSPDLLSRIGRRSRSRAGRGGAHPISSNASRTVASKRFQPLRAVCHSM